MEQHELIALTSSVEAPHPEEEVPAWVDPFGRGPRTCPGCGQTDNHPRKRLITDLGEVDADDNVVRPGKVDEWHFDCHALSTRDLHSIEVVQQAGGAKGHELRVLMYGDPVNGIAPTIDPATAATPMSPATVGPAADADLENQEG